jgi:hypothetical protein
MSVILDGNLGITTPAETVQGALTTTGNTILGDATTDTLNVGAGGLVKDASGNVGIGTASPVGKLDIISGTARMFFSNQSATAFFTAVNTTNTAYAPMAINGSELILKTGDAERARIDSSGNLLFNSGYGSVATAYGCRAWVNFNGTGTVAIRASGNVSSITDNGTGNYTINFTTAMPDANYAMTASGVYTTTASDYKLTFYPVATPATTTTLQVRSTAASSDGAIDAVINCCSIFR